MNDVQRIPGRYHVSLRWTTRALSIVVSGAFLLIMVLAVTNEDLPHRAAIPVLIVLELTVVAAVAAWRCEKVGGVVVVLLALCLGAAAYLSSLAVGLSHLSYLPALIYGAPFVVVGVLFWICGRTEASGPPHDVAALAPVLRGWWFIGVVLASIIAFSAIVAAVVTAL